MTFIDVFCYSCEQTVNAKSVADIYSKKINGLEVNYFGEQAYCEKCGKEIEIQRLIISNRKAAKAKYDMVMRERRKNENNRNG